MKSQIILSIVLCLLINSGRAQDVPNCIKSLNKKNSLSTTKFERIIQLKGNRTVYEFSVSSVAQCIDCTRGTVFYDENCNQIASFMMGRGASGFVEYGYTAAELGKAGFSNIKYGVMQDPLPGCMEKILANSDSLNKAGVIKIVQVRIKDKVLYGFEHQIDPKLVNCKDCSRSIVYYNAGCKPEVTFKIGGIAGIKGEKGYTATDFMRKTILRTIWNANTSRTGNAAKNP